MAERSEKPLPGNCKRRNRKKPVPLIMMLKGNHRSFRLICIAALIISCGRKSEDENKVLARVGDKKLHYSDLADFYLENRGNGDSAILTSGFIENWIKQQVLLEKAEDNLPSDQKKLEKQVQDYKSTLLIYEYQKQLINQMLDT